MFVRYACKGKVTDAHVVVDVKTGKSEKKKGHLETWRGRCERHTDLSNQGRFSSSTRLLFDS